MIKDSSLRYPPELQDKLVRGAALAGESRSDFIRKAIEERFQRLQSTTRTVLEEWSDLIGVLEAASDGESAAPDPFADHLVEKHGLTFKS